MKYQAEILELAKQQRIPEGFRFLGTEYTKGRYFAVFWKGSIGDSERHYSDITEEVKKLRKKLESK